MGSYQSYQHNVFLFTRRNLVWTKTKVLLCISVWYQWCTPSISWFTTSFIINIFIRSPRIRGKNHLYILGVPIPVGASTDCGRCGSVVSCYKGKENEFMLPASGSPMLFQLRLLWYRLSRKSSFSGRMWISTSKWVPTMDTYKQIKSVVVHLCAGMRIQVGLIVNLCPHGRGSATTIWVGRGHRDWVARITFEQHSAAQRCIREFVGGYPSWQ